VDSHHHKSSDLSSTRQTLQLLGRKRTSGDGSDVSLEYKPKLNLQLKIQSLGTFLAFQNFFIRLPVSKSALAPSKQLNMQTTNTSIEDSNAARACTLLGGRSWCDLETRSGIS